MSYKILIVDDSKLARMSIAKVLNGLRPDWIRVEAANAEEAVAKVRAERPDIAMLDYNMPGRDGLQLAADLRAIEPHMPLAVVSANIQDEIVARTHDLGAAFLAKPVVAQALSDFLTAAQARLKATAT
ncbi:MAG TPA: response regulator [Caulobacteraceae bacterium]|nr:response regulator [Caulobacteraceae bacterium]